MRQKSTGFIKDRSVVNELTFQVEIIKKLVTQNMLLSESFCLVKELGEKINIIPGPKGSTLKTKLNYIFSKNKGLKILRKVNKVLLGEVKAFQLDENYQDPMILSSFKFALITLANVERSFSICKHVLSCIFYCNFKQKYLCIYLYVFLCIHIYFFIL
jgi:hypothetical protein